MSEDLLKEHDRELAKLFIATERLAEGQERLSSHVEKTNDKLDKLVDNTNKVDILMAQLVETTKHFQDSMSRAYKRIEAIETTQTTSGCPVVQRYFSEREHIIEKYDLLHKTLDSRLTKIEAWQEKVTWALLTKGVVLLGILVGVIYEASLK